MENVIPPRFREGWGTWHAKIYGVDDEVIISGWVFFQASVNVKFHCSVCRANLNNSYFTNRQDRYIYFSSSPRLAEYCVAFLGAVSTVSYRLVKAAMQSDAHVLEWPHRDVGPSNIHGKGRRALMQVNKWFMEHPDNERTIFNDDSVTLFPIIQAGQFQIYDEEIFLALLFRHLSQDSSRMSVDLTSGYFGLYKSYQLGILRSGSAYRIIAASPQVCSYLDRYHIWSYVKANGFYGSAGISGRIPDAYTLKEQEFMEAVKREGRIWSATRQSGVELSEWAKPDWTYHAKGMFRRLWMSPRFLQ